MKTEITIHIRAFDVTLQDQRTGEQFKDTVVLTKEQLQACQTVGQSSKELIARLCARQGFKVVDVGAASKKSVTLDLRILYELQKEVEELQREVEGLGQ